MKDNYLLTGGSGKLGSHIRKLISCDSPPHAEMDILNKNQLERHFQNKFNGVIHLAAVSSQKTAEIFQEESYRINVLGSRNVAQIAFQRGLKVFYLSTDYVFPGTIGNYKETDIPKPANWYGYTKLAGEWEIRLQTKKWCIIRTSFRPSIWEFPNAFTNVFTSADYVDVIAREIALSIQKNLFGLIHLGTPKKSFFELARKRNPDIEPEVCEDSFFPKKRDLCLDKWNQLKGEKNEFKKS